MAAADYVSAVQQLYIAYFGRPADVGGLADFTAQLNALGVTATAKGISDAYSTNATVKTLVDQFGTSAESAALYGSGTTESFVFQIYDNVLNRVPDAEGFAFWVNAINSGSLTRGNAAMSIMAGALANTSAQGLLDAQLINARTTVATSFTNTITSGGYTYAGDAAAATARAMLDTVVATTDTTAFQSTITSTLVQITNPGAGSTFTLTTAATNAVVGTSLNDTIDGTTTDSLNTGDRVTDTSTTDADVLNAVVTGTAAAPTLTSVETLNITAKYGSGGIDLTNSSGYTTVNLNSAIAAGTVRAANVSEPVTVVAGTNVSSVTVTAKATVGTGGEVVVNAGNATSVTLTGGSGADTFTTTMAAVGSLNMNGADAGNDTYTATLANGNNTVALNMGAGTDAATLNLAGGTLTLTGNVANEALTINSTGAANVVNATATVATGATGGTITFAGDQNLTLKDSSANLSGVTITDNNTATTKVQITGTTDQNDLSKISADTIEIQNYTTSDELKIKNGSTLTFTKTGGNSGAALELGASAASGTVNLVMATDADITNGGSTTHTTKFTTINVSSDAATGTISTAILAGADATINVTGSKAVTLENTSTAKAVVASTLNAKLTAETTANLVSITGGLIGDAITVSNAQYDGVADDTNVAVLVDAGAGNDIVTVAGITAPTDTDATFTLDGGADTDTLVFSVTSDLSATAGWKAAVITGFENISTGGNTLTLTQKQLFTNGGTFTIKGGGTFNIVDDGASSKVFDLSGMALEAGVAAPTIAITGHATEANIIKGAASATTMTGGSAADTITGYAGNDVINAGAGADIINVGTGTDTLAIKAAAGAAGGDSGTFAKPATNTIATTTFDVVTGMAAGDKIQLLATAYTGNAGAAAGLIANGTAASDLSTVTLVDNGLVLVRGTYSSGTFVGSSSGADTMVIYDSDATLTTTAYEAVVLVGYVAASVTGIGGNAGLVTLA